MSLMARAMVLWLYLMWSLYHARKPRNSSADLTTVMASSFTTVHKSSYSSPEIFETSPFSANWFNSSSSKSELARSTFSMISNTSRSAPRMARLNPKAQSLHSDWLQLKSFNFIHLGFSRYFDPAGTLSPNLPMNIKNCSSVKVNPAMTTAEKGWDRTRWIWGKTQAGVERLDTHSTCTKKGRDVCCTPNSPPPSNPFSDRR